MSWNIRFLSTDDLSWPDRGNPFFRVGAGSYGGRNVEVVPRPMYAHDQDLVIGLLRAIEHRHPLTGARCEIAVLDREFSSGFNGYAMPDTIWKRADGSDWSFQIKSPDGSTFHANGQALSIVLSGKPVPQHPAWTRYLVGHEYGHAAFYHWARLNGLATHKDEGEIAYMSAARGLDGWKDGKSWHQKASEVIANDFRICVGELEVDFWQHDVPPPDERVREWWRVAAEVSRVGHPEDLR